jgi:hypothetical protein
VESLYSKYVKEKYGQECLEDDYSFMTYRVSGRVCVIEVAYTVPEKRRSGQAKELLTRIVQKLPKDVKYLSCEVDTSAHNGMQSYQAIRSYGFEPLKTNGNNIVMVKYL